MLGRDYEQHQQATHGLYLRQRPAEGDARGGKEIKKYEVDNHLPHSFLWRFRLITLSQFPFSIALHHRHHNLFLGAIGLVDQHKDLHQLER